MCLDTTGTSKQRIFIINAAGYYHRERTVTKILVELILRIITKRVKQKFTKIQGLYKKKHKNRYLDQHCSVN